MLETPPLALYIHIPWCIRKCPYCDFNSHQLDSKLPEKEYCQALCEDFDAERDNIAEREIRSIFIGGGTPSLFSADSIARCLDHIKNTAQVAADAEITLEANPGATDAGNIRSLRSAGVNRLSIGIQSFNNKALQQLGRVHDNMEARQAYNIARNVGFENINVDLMHGLPGQTVEEALQDLKIALSLQPDHLSWYELTIEPNTVFYNNPPQLPDEVVILEEEEAGQELLSSSGFERYEVSAYAKPNYQSVHNINYWEFGDYIGIGAGAHGKISCDDSGKIIRTRKHKQPDHYIASSASRVAERKPIEDNELSVEFLLNALRLRQGFEIELFSARTGLTFETISKQVEYLLSKGLARRDKQRIAATDKGYLHLNHLLEAFL